MKLVFLFSTYLLLYILPTLTFKNSAWCLHCIYVFCVISEQTVNFALYIIKISVSITEEESVYSAVRTESLYNTEAFGL